MSPNQGTDQTLPGHNSKFPTFSCIFVLISYNIPEGFVYDKLLLQFYYVSNLDNIYNFNLITLIDYSFFISSIYMKISKILQHITHKQYYIIASSTDKKKFQTVLTFFFMVYIHHSRHNVISIQNWQFNPFSNKTCLNV